jgi:hypothetical protein
MIESDGKEAGGRLDPEVGLEEAMAAGGGSDARQDVDSGAAAELSGIWSAQGNSKV